MSLLKVWIKAKKVCIEVKLFILFPGHLFKWIITTINTIQTTINMPVSLSWPKCVIERNIIKIKSILIVLRTRSSKYYVANSRNKSNIIN